MTSILDSTEAFIHGVSPAPSILDSTDAFIHGVSDPALMASDAGNSTEGGWEDWYFKNVGLASSAGVSVTHKKAMTHPTVRACVNAVAESIAGLPLNVFFREDNGDKSKTSGSPAVRVFVRNLQRILHDQTNSEDTAIEFREKMQTWASTRGWAAAEIIPGSRRGTAGAVGELVPLHPDDIVPRRQVDNSGRARWVFEYHPTDAPERVILRDEIFLLRAFNTDHDSIFGVDTIMQQRETIGAAIATIEYAARWFAADGRPVGVLEHPQRFQKDEDRQRFLRAFSDGFTGANRHNIPLLEAGLKFNQIGTTQNEAQYLETRQQQNLEICSIFRVQPHKVGILSEAKFKNIEQQSIEWVTDTLMPWLIRWEQAIHRDLITHPDIFAEHNVLGLLRGDVETRYKAYAVARNWGWLSVNDILRLENLNSIGPDGDVYLQPLNMVEAGEAAEPSAANRPAADREQRAFGMEKKGQLWLPKNL